MAVLLNPRRSQTCEAVLIDGKLPAQEFFRSQRVSLTGFLEAQKTTTHGSDDLGLTADHPSTGGRWRKIGNRQRTAIRPNDILDPWAVGFGHDTLTQKFNDLVGLKLRHGT